MLVDLMRSTDTRDAEGLLRTMLVSTLITEAEVWSAMCRRFPWVSEERGDIGEGLIHLDFAALRRGVEEAAGSRDAAAACDILTFVEQLLEKIDVLHPEVINALDVSFLEDLYFCEQRQRDFVVPLLGPRSKERWDELVAAHRERSG